MPHLDACLGAWGTTSLLHGVVFIFAIFSIQIYRNHKPQKDAVKCLSRLIRGLLHITAHDTLLSTGKAIAQHLFAVRGSCGFV